jgi:hypothetical protein
LPMPSDDKPDQKLQSWQTRAKIKVILITPVASEGLSFNNTREIHLIEPWLLNMNI